MFSRKPKGATIYYEKNNTLSSMIWMLVGAVATLAIGAYAYKTSSFGLNESDTEEEYVAVTQKDHQVRPKIEEDSDTNYDFYEILPEENIPTVVSITDGQPAEIEESSIQQKDDTAFKPDVVIDETSQPKVEESAKNIAKAMLNTVSVSNTVKNQVNSTNIKDKDDAKVKEANQTLTVTEPKSPILKPLKPNSNYGSNVDKEGMTSEDIINASDDINDAAKSTVDDINDDENSSSEAASNDTNITDNAQRKANSQEDDTVVSEDTAAVKVELDEKAATEEAESEKAAAEAEVAAAIAKAQAAKKDKKVIKTFILQINSYNDADKADTRRAQVLMTGVEARVVKNSGMYRVVSESLSSPREVLEQQRKLQKSGIHSVIIEQRR